MGKEPGGAEAASSRHFFSIVKLHLFLCCRDAAEMNVWKAAALVLAALQPAFAAHPLTTIHTVHWNASNPLFRRRVLDADHDVISVNSGNHPWEYDQVNIVCPTYGGGYTHPELEEQYVIYSVTEREYQYCKIMQPNPKIVAVCNRPHEQMYFTITFRSFTPTPGGLEFRPGQDYYFISTSSRKDLHRRVGGSCSSNNMKIVFRVAPKIDSTRRQAEAAAHRPAAALRQFPWSNREDFRRTFSSPFRSESQVMKRLGRGRRRNKAAESEMHAGAGGEGGEGGAGGTSTASPSINLMATAAVSLSLAFLGH